MKREIMIKIIFALIISVMLFTMSVKVYAEPQDLDSFWEDQGSKEDLEGETPTETPTPEAEPSAPPTSEPEEELPEAGLAEDTMMVATIVGLVILATVAYKKVNEYQNI